MLRSVGVFAAGVLGVVGVVMVQDGPRDAAPKAASTAIICHPDEPGDRVLIAGVVVGSGGAPVAGAEVVAWNADQRGQYADGGGPEAEPRIKGAVRTDEAGRFQVLTVRPGPYPGGREPAHVHMEVRHPSHALTYSTIWFEGDPLITPERHAWQARDRETEVVAVEAGPGGLPLVRHTIRMWAK